MIDIFQLYREKYYMKRKQKSEKMQMKKDLMVVQRYNANVVLCYWVIPEKIHPDGWQTGNSHRRGG